MNDDVVGSKTRSIHVANGCQELFVSTSGAGPAVFVLHGLGATHEHTQGMRNALVDRFTVIAPDLRGHGRSSPARDVAQYSFEEHANDMVAVLDHLGIEHAAFTGYSYGADISLATALRHPDRVWAVVVIGNGLGGRHLAPEGDEPLKVFADLADRVEAGGLDALEPAQRNGWEQHDRDSLVSFLRATQTHRPFDDLEELRAIAQPVLVVPGNDPVHPRALGEAYMTVLPNAEWVELRMSMPPTPQDIDTMLHRMRTFLHTHHPVAAS